MPEGTTLDPIVGVDDLPGVYCAIRIISTYVPTMHPLEQKVVLDYLELGTEFIRRNVPTDRPGPGDGGHQCACQPAAAEHQRAAGAALRGLRAA